MKYEYKTVWKNLNVDELNELGKEGWELVSVVELPSSIGEIFTVSGAQHFYFKREIE